MTGLISEEDYDDLPDDDERCFVVFEDRIHHKMNAILDNDRVSASLYQSIKSQYMASVYGVALECGISSLPNIPSFSSDGEFL